MPFVLCKGRTRIATGDPVAHNWKFVVRKYDPLLRNCDFVSRKASPVIR
jgi:hypothetical protein